MDRYLLGPRCASGNPNPFVKPTKKTHRPSIGPFNVTQITWRTTSIAKARGVVPGLLAFRIYWVTYLCVSAMFELAEYLCIAEEDLSFDILLAWVKLLSIVFGHIMGDAYS